MNITDTLDSAISQKAPEKICLFTSYFLPADEERQKEVVEAIERNIACSHIDRIVLFCEGTQTPDLDSQKIEFRFIAGRPTYEMWLSETSKLPDEFVSVFANSDIYFDETISRLKDTSFDDRSLVALTRWEDCVTHIDMHPNPRWSQDTWALRGGAHFPIQLLKESDFPIGVPRCDNRLAYLFHIYGWRVFNPVAHIRSLHLHNSSVRNYDKRKDTTIVGGTAYVHPSSLFGSPADIEIDIYTLNAQRPITTKINNMLCAEPAPERSNSSRPATPGLYRFSPYFPSAIPPPVDIAKTPAGNDHFWQFPCITERDAWELHANLPHFGNVDLGQKIVNVYVGLPWATYIDRRSDISAILPPINAQISALREDAARHGFTLRAHTVCQHISWSTRLPEIKQAGITDVHLSHCTNDAIRLCHEAGLRCHSWPLYAVNFEDPARRSGYLEIALEDRQYLASFKGAYMPHYRSDVRIAMMEEFHGRPDVLFELTYAWHFDPIVYEGQVAGKEQTLEQIAVEKRKTAEYNSLLSNSVFSLCPEGAGPNTLRLWESLAFGAIPVVAADEWIPPVEPSAAPQLRDICIFVSRAEIPGLYDRLKRIDLAEARERVCAGKELYQRFRTRLAF